MAALETGVSAAEMGSRTAASFICNDSDLAAHHVNGLPRHAFRLRNQEILVVLNSYWLNLICVILLSTVSVAQNGPTAQPTTPEAQLRLGNDYLAQKDYSSAMFWFRKAAERSNSVAENNIGWLYENGFGVKQDYTEALNWFRKAASGGYAEAQNNIGWVYQNGWGVKQDYVEAMTWYRKAAQQGNVRASTNIGFLYNNGLGVKQDYSEAATWYQVAAQHGNVKAQVYLGQLYQNGKGVEQDYAVAMAWYARAADTGDSEAQMDIGYLYEHGFGVIQDHAKAMNWYRKAAAQENAQAERSIGSLYEKGLGVSQDASEAQDWYKKAAEHTLLPGGIRPPRVIYSPDPEYSEEANQAKFEGTCVLSLVIDADGNTRDVKVVKSLGKGLDEKAIDAIKTWKFMPGTKDGVPVATQIAIEVEFHLK